MAARIKINRAKVGRILKDDMRVPIDALAAQIAARVEVGGSSGAEVTVRSYTTDRAAAAVSIAHPAGLAIEALRGPLRKAAASLGLEVKSKP